MSNRVILRACASPLLPQHLVAALAPIDGMGFGADETQTFGRGYHEIALKACEEEIARNLAFNEAIRGKFLEPIQRPLSKLTPKNQFLAMAPAIEICDLSPKTENVLEALISGPFVITFRTLGTLDRARRSDADPVVSQSKLAGFIEHYLGCSAALFYERSQPTLIERISATA